MTVATGRRKFVVGNWKMHGLRADLGEVKAIAAAHEALADRCDAGLCPPAPLLAEAVAVCAAAPLKLGAQDCHAQASGAFTGDISAEMIADQGAELVIIGHSERRRDHGERDEMIAAKARAARRAGLHPIICIGETETERDAGATLERLAAQIDGGAPQEFSADAFTIAYEPVWAIGTGRTPSPEEIDEAHGFICDRLRARLGEASAPRILYGGSVKPENAENLFQILSVDGALVGGASLKAESFIQIVRSAAQS